ncbi:MAG: hypothetical protein DWQ34_09145 [Planctomycetota bacterium]|nr:MAG: hypothetical protein DWQ29_14485 [Planctomycetota bacterium]REJ94233.1 MAG: hypothetical protein DWQ34_09145 [Planctomycetota bacterium]REK20213.1 MAG: hypothetical protein DWQ41_26080 [Planctomycetota bacterium]REK35333.1 MAG: hypothetical protein DWQ45_11440 [Planctomycetota bacterium]
MTTRTSTKKSVGNGFVEHATPLLREYTAKLEESVRNADELHDLYYLAELENGESERGSSASKRLQDERRRSIRERLARIQSRVKKLTPAINQLDRQVSQMIEHGELGSELERVELKLRLNELEDMLAAARKIKSSFPTAG